MAKVSDRVRTIIDTVGRDVPRRQQGQQGEQREETPKERLLRILAALRAAVERTQKKLEFVLDEGNETIVVLLDTGTTKRRLRAIPFDEAERLARALTDNHNLLDRWG